MTLGFTLLFGHSFALLAMLLLAVGLVMHFTTPPTAGIGRWKMIARIGLASGALYLWSDFLLRYVAVRLQ